MPAADWSPERIEGVRKYWADAIEECPSLRRLIHPAVNKTIANIMMCPSCGFPGVNVRSLHAHLQTAQCAARQEAIAAIREGYTKVDYKNAPFSLKVSVPFRKAFKTGVTNDGAHAKVCAEFWVQEWWADLARHAYLTPEGREMLEDLAAAYSIKDDTAVERIRGMLELIAEK